MPLPDSLIARLLVFAERQPTRHAIVSSEYSLSYQALAQLVEFQAKKLREAGVSAESVVAIRCADDVQHLLLCLACIHIGATSCTVPTHDSKTTQDTLLERCGATLVIDQALAVDLASFEYQGNTNQDAAHAEFASLLFSTSGTTGEPKLVVHHDSDLVAQAHRHVNTADEHFACLASIEHNFVKRHRLYCLAMGACNVFLNADQETLVAQIQSLNVNVLYVTVFQAQELLAVPGVDQLANMRLKMGGSHASLALRQRLRKGITQNLQAGYGTTETGAIGFTDADDAEAGESVGRALPGIEARVVGPDRQVLPTGERGELAIRGAGMFRGYLNNPELTKARLEDGWFYTGDLACLDEAGRIQLGGRSDDMFVFNSINIFPQDIESHICRHPDVVDAVVVPCASAAHGDIPVAYIVFDESAAADLPALRTWLQQELGVRCPRRLTRVDEIPRNATGKIARNESLNLAVTRESVREDIVQTLRASNRVHLSPALAADFVSGKRDIRPRDVGLDSLSRMNLMVMLEVQYDLIIAPDEFMALRTLGEISDWALHPPDHAMLQQVQEEPAPGTQAVGERARKSEPVIAFFQRVIHHCPTAGQLHKALTTLEHRLTPGEIRTLLAEHEGHRLVGPETPQKIRAPLDRWFAWVDRMMRDSGKPEAEPFVARRLAPTLTLFEGPGSPAQKTLLVCFPGSGDRKLLMPNAVLLQHTNAARYDVMVVSEPLRRGYRHGVPGLGNTLTDVVEHIARLPLVSDYQRIRTLGCSAGGYAAIVAGYALGAELAVSSGGRFHSERYPGRILDRLWTTWRATKNGSCDQVLMTYAMDKTRDRTFAKVMARICDGSRLGVRFTDGEIGHLLMQRLAERGRLGPYLARTVFSEQAPSEREHTILNLPENTLDPEHN